MKLSNSQTIGLGVGTLSGIYFGVWASNEITDLLFDSQLEHSEHGEWANHIAATSSLVLVPIALLLSMPAGFAIGTKLSNTKQSAFLSFSSLWQSADDAIKMFVDSSNKPPKDVDLKHDSFHIA